MNTVHSVSVPRIVYARFLMRAVGVMAAATYLKNCGWPIETTLFQLLGVR